ncbi:tetratricopeptide repeat protein [Leucobacter insecticola]|uniref:Tetratricopeptide repeat protein n=1 Tax=Leucobacter insecticola TaxID=2714934 RepID=A0A6G8FK67_9MICO|nr:tetratricopeptide repeat protein [Leucobacter insecticola]QIM16767.1 tetratricopeptide repeat protein [Leucobacter insecticola]
MTQHIPERIPGGGIDLSHLAASRAQAQPGLPGEAAPAGGAPQVVDVPALVIDVTDASFEQVAQLSAVVPVVIDLWAEWCEPCKTLGPVLEKLTREFGGRLLLAKVDVDANPGLAQAFQAQSIPTVVALVGGRPVPLFQGAMPEAQVREVFGQLLQLAAQQGVVGSVNAPESSEEAPAEPVEPPIPAAHLAAVEAAERGDYAAAVSEWEAVLTKSPADAEARAALVQMKLLQRLEGLTLDGVRADAAARPNDLEAQLRVADLDLSGGHVEDAFLRLLDLFAAASEEDRAVIQARLLELFEVVGVADPRVIAARGRLANLLY